MKGLKLIIFLVIQSSLLGPVPWNSQPAPVSSQTESAQLKEGIAVIERSTGRVIAGMAAPSQEEIVDWLHDHPTFEVLRPSGWCSFQFTIKACPLSCGLC